MVLRKVIVGALQAVPERPGAQLAPEGRNPFGDQFQRLLEHDDIHRLGERDAHPVQGCVVPAQRSGVDVRRIVDPHPCGNLESLCHTLVALGSGYESITRATGGQIKVANGAKM